jgi:CubicO group peptidase (beta-lactamase class C family)
MISHRQTRARLAAGTLLLSLLASQSVTAAENSLAPAIIANVEAVQKQQQIPGLALMVMENGSIRHAQGFGLANIELGVPVTPQSMFQTGSIGKMFTAVLILKLAESGRIGLDDPVAKHLPGTPAAWSGITVRMMLNHTSGIPNYVLADYQRIVRDGEAELARIAYEKPLDFTPGSQWRYSNTAYVLLGQLIAKVTGRFYGDLLVEQVFRPLGMKTAQPISERDIVPGRVAGYEIEGKELKNQSYVPQSLNSTADGSLYFSLMDYAAWEQAVRRRDPVLSKASWAEMFRPARLTTGEHVAYGMGWDVRSGKGFALRGHGGSWQGFQTHYLAVERPQQPEADLAVVVLTNNAQADPSVIAADVAKALAPDAAALITCQVKAMAQPCEASPQ